MLFCEKLKGGANFHSFLIEYLPVLRNIISQYSVQIVLLFDFIT